MEGFEHVLPVEVGVTSLSLYPGSTPCCRANRTNETAILSDISLRIPGSSLTAIMGGSGSGKTSLLNALAGRSNGFLSGTVTMNGRPASDYSGKIAYVQQNDQLLPFLTVRDTLRYAARLRLPNDMPIQKKYELVESVLLELNLKECADTIIGDDRRKGCSGGEKRRVSIGVQLLVNPSVIYMDEPTTGLDSTTSLSLIETLVSLCRRGRTVCISIHQPRTAIFSKFENVILLTGGNLIYSGPCADVLDHFAKNAHPIPDKINPADFLIDVTSVDNRDAVAEEASKTRINLLVDAWASEKKQGSASPIWGQEAGDMELISQASTKDGTAVDVPDGQLLGRRRMGASPLNQTIILAQRTFHNLLQDRLTLWGSVLEVIILAAAVGAIFYKLDETQQGILGRKASLYIVASVQNYLGLMFAVFKLSLEMKVFDRERLDRMYGVVPYLLGWLIANFALYTALASLFSVIIYYMMGLRTDSLAHLGVFMLGNVLMQFVTISWAYFCIAWARDFATASLIANSFFTFLSTSSGFFIQLDQIPVYLRWFEHISYVTYGYRLLATNEFSGVTFACPDMPPGEKSCQGEVILKSLAFGVDDYVYPAVALLLNYVGLMVLAALVLQFKPQGGPTHAASVKKDKIKTEIRDEEAQSVENESSVPRVDIRLENVTLMLTKTSPTKSDSAKTVTILDNISAEFKPGELSIVLGASGAGKTSLMNVLMGRGLQAGPFTKTHQSGRILYRGIEMEDRAQIATMVSLCVQDDHHLLPGLSARETLRYSAILRLPAEIPEDEKIRRADKVLLELGLKSCADRLVGGEGVKGLSGGEKRRLSIGIQILTNPAVLIIDEPTSGLDAYTSHNLIVKLKSIASSGRTVICSIHQPRSDIVNLFDFSLLLARGGRTVFSGESSKMLPYFAQLDHPIPPFTNPADFALDLSSIDLRNAEAEASSRARVNELIRVWRTDAERDRALGLLAEEEPDASSKRLAGSASDLDLSALGYRSPARFAVALSVLVKRSMRNMLRQPKLASARIMQVVALAVIFALYFSRLHLTQPSVQSRFGLLQQQGSLIFVGMLNCIAVFPQELSLMRFEYRDNVYSVGSFFLSYCINEFPFEVASALLYAVVTMFAIGLQASVSNFFVLAYLAFCLLNTGESLGIAFCAMVDSVGFSVQIMSTVMSLQVMMAGFLSVTMPGFLQGLNYVFITRYVARLLAVQEFDGLHFFCQPSEVAAGTCMYQTGSDALALLKFDDSHSAWVFNLIMVAALTLGVRAIAYAVLWSRTKV